MIPFDLSSLGELHKEMKSQVMSTSKYKEAGKIIRYYEFSHATPERRAVFLAQCLFFAKNGGISTPNAGVWIYSWLDACLPGLVAAIYERHPSVAVQGQPLSAEEIEVNRGARPPVDANGELCSYLELFPDEVFDQQRLLDVDYQEMIGVASTLIFAIAKRPNPENLTAFTVNRPRAFMGKAGIIPETTRTLNHPERMPGLEAYSVIHGYFNMYPIEREAVVKEFVTWVGIGGSFEKEAISMVVKLWEHAGETHIGLIRNLLTQYGDVLVRFPILREEMRKFVAQYKRVTAQTQIHQSYAQAIYGDRGSKMRSRDYEELLKVARELASRVDARYKRYAAGINRSQLMDQIEEEAVKMGVPLPPKVEESASAI